MDIKQESTFSGIIREIINGNLEKSSLLENTPLMTEYKSFEESIRNSFDDLVGKSTDLDGNSEAVS